MALATRKRKPRTRQGEASVITEELLNEVEAAIAALEGDDDLAVLDDHPRATPGSAAGFGYQIREKLDARGVKVHSSPVPVDEEAWDTLTEGLSQAEVSDLIKRVKVSGTDTERAAIRHYAAFYPYNK